MPKANLFIVGAPKCGTTAWWHYLSQHPDVFMTNPKEPHYFNSDFENFRWVKTREQYDQLFSAAGKARVCGEASVMYLYSEESAKNIYEYNSDARILIFLRNHADFIRSYHQQLLLNLDENEADLEVALGLEAARSRGDCVPKTCRDSRLLEYSRVATFAPQVERYIKAFGRDRVRVLWMEDWAGSLSANWQSVVQFLGLSSDINITFDRINAAREARSTLISGLYRRPPGWLKGVARVSRRVGFDSEQLKKIMRRLNEIPARSSSSKRVQGGRALDSVFRKDMMELQSIGCGPVSGGQRLWA